MKSKKNFIVFTLISLLFINYIGTHLMYGLYMADQALFVEWFCENKDHPEEHCDGSCMISKLSDHDHHQSDNPSLMDVFQVQLVFYIPEANFEIPLPEEVVKTSFIYHNHYVFEFEEDTIHPPIPA